MHLLPLCRNLRQKVVIQQKVNIHHTVKSGHPQKLLNFNNAGIYTDIENAVKRSENQTPVSRKSIKNIRPV